MQINTISCSLPPVVFRSKYSEMQYVMEKDGGGGVGDAEARDDDDRVVRLRGLPFQCTKSDIEQFFEGKSWKLALRFARSRARWPQWRAARRRKRSHYPSIHWVVLGLDITHDGILMTTDYQGRSSGEAFVHFTSRDHAERALEKNKETIGHRWGEEGSKKRKTGLQQRPGGVPS